MSDDATCCECHQPVSYETGFSLVGGLGDSSLDRLYCPEHAPDQGKAYTLADLQRVRDEIDKARRDRAVSLVEQVGADVYFHALGPTFPPDEIS